MPARGEISFDMPYYRAKNDSRPVEQDIGVKYWTTNAADCEDGGVKPGFTTPEEAGPMPSPLTVPTRIP